MEERTTSRHQTEEQVTAAINAKVSSTYKAGGSAAFADLPELTEGWSYSPVVSPPLGSGSLNRARTSSVVA